MIMIAEMYCRNSKASRCLPESLMTFIDDLGRLTEARSGVGTYWPRIEEALTLEGINTPCVRAGVAATVGTEVYGFAPGRGAPE